MDDDATLPFQKLDCYRIAKALAVRVHQARIRDTELRDQATRAAKSQFLNLSGGLPSEQPGVRRRYLRARRARCAKSRRRYADAFFPPARSSRKPHDATASGSAPQAPAPKPNPPS